MKSPIAKIFLIGLLPGLIGSNAYGQSSDVGGDLKLENKIDSFVQSAIGEDNKNEAILSTVKNSEIKGDVRINRIIGKNTAIK